MRRPLIGQARDRGPRYLLLTIISFAITVIAVRVYLDMAGYPKVGGGGLHVAHLLWGGLLLVVAALLVQLFVGRRVLTLSAIAAGVGVGLFIDEVGKFLTETNDYFFAPAAPIIYGAILLLVLVWLLVRRTRHPSMGAATQAAIEATRDLADGRLTEDDRTRIVEMLRIAGATEAGDQLGDSLLVLLSSPTTTSQLARPGRLQGSSFVALFRRIVPRRLELLVICIGLLLTALAGLFGALIAVALLSGIEPSFSQSSGPIEYPTEPVWLLALAAVWITVGLANGLALVLTLLRRTAAGMTLAQFGFLISLVAGGLLNTFVSQLGALSDVLLTLGLLLLVFDQRQRLTASDASRPTTDGTTWAIAR